MKKEKSCGAVVINDKNEVLLVYHNAGHISFPKGHVENNETEVETAYREVLEETGIEIEIMDNIREVNIYNLKGGIVKDVVFFKAKPITNILKPQLEEVFKVCFMDINKAFDIITYDSDRQILRRIIERSDKDEY